MSESGGHVFRVFALDDVRVGEAASLPASELHHVNVVLRGAKSGLEVVAPDGAIFSARVVGKAVVAEALIRAPMVQSLGIEVMIGMLTGAAWDAALDAVTQAGATSISCVYATEKECLAAEKRRERSERIIRAAARQSKRDQIPILHDPIGWDHLKDRHVGRQDSLRVVLDPSANLDLVEHLTQMLPTVEGVQLLIGGSGGFPPGIERSLDEAGWGFVSIGANVYRAELAAGVAVGITSLLAQRK